MLDDFHFFTIIEKVSKNNPNLRQKDLKKENEEPKKELQKFTQIKKENEDLKKENEKLKKEFARLYADFDNYRKRVAKENEEFKKLALEDFMKDITLVLENYERAILHKAISQDSKEFLDGIELIFKKLKEILKKYGLEEYSCIGEEFDPAKAEAIASLETNDSPPNTVVDEIRKGYMLNGKVIKPALVTVTKQKGGDK